MSKITNPPENCLMGGCDTIGKCSRCGFDRAENKRRKSLPLVTGTDGLRRKIIPAKKEISYEQEDSDINAKGSEADDEN